MTRFARAKGSKASNQRIPDEASSWSELKQQIRDGRNDTHGNDNFEEETNWKEVINTEKKIEENVKSVWCDFSDDEDKKFHQSREKRKRKMTNSKMNTNFDYSLKKNKKRKVESINEHEDGNLGDNKEYEKNKNKKLEQNCAAVQSEEVESSSAAVNNPSDWVSEFEWKDSENHEKSHSQNEQSFDNVNQNKRFRGSKNWSITGKEFKKFSRERHIRRKADPGDLTLDINGQKIVVTKLDGFYIRKEDADRIKELENDMIKRGIPKTEIQAVVKRERRNAEKSLARQKKKVCFHCRKGGHNLSSCPKLNEGGAQIIGSGICYKCGSTEHSHIHCRVASGQTFKFATCFICKEEGHIAKQCPDNPRGLYPDGGACKLCGDVTHFKKDCPSLPTKAKVTVGTIDRDIETLDNAEQDQQKVSNIKKKKKFIKFK